MLSRRAVSLALPAVTMTGGPAVASNPPAISMGAIFAPGQTSSGGTGLWFDRSGHIRMDVQINDVHASAIVDSGAGRSVLDEAFVKRISLSVRDGFKVYGLTGEAMGGLADDVAVSIGNLTLSGVTAGVLNLNPYPLGGEAPVDVVLGRELFASTLVDINLQAMVIEFLNIKTQHRPAGAVAVPLEQGERGTPYIQMVVGDAPIWAAFDLGYNASLLMSPDLVERHQLLAGRSTSTVASRGVEGMVISRVATLPKISLGGLSLTDVPIEVPPNWNRPRPALLGLDILKRFRIVTDYAHGRVWFSRIDALSRFPLPRDRSGIGAVPTKGGLSVIHVAEHSPAEASGLKVGDLIVAINGETVDYPYIISHPRMGAGPAGTRFDLTLSDNRRLTFTLKDYF